VYVDGGTFTMEDGSVEGNTANRNGGGVYLSRTSAITKTGGYIYGNDTSTDQANVVTGQTDKGAAVYVEALARLEKTVDAAHNLTKEETDTDAASLTAEKGWTE
jgi:parallel beta-helix repeat protein